MPSETAAELFLLLWQHLSDVLGTTAAATVIRRAVRRAARSRPELANLSVERTSLDYGYRLPPDWLDGARGGDLEGLRDVARELRHLLVELTGPVVVARLDQLEPFRRNGIRFTDTT